MLRQSSISIRALIPSWGSHPHKLSNYLLKTPHPNPITLEVRLSTYEFREDTDIQSIALSHSDIDSFSKLLCVYVLDLVLHTGQEGRAKRRHCPSDFPGDSDGKESACNAGDLGLIPGLGRSFGEGNGNPLQYSCLENPMDRGAWHATIHAVAESRTRLSDCHDCPYSSINLERRKQ